MPNKPENNDVIILAHGDGGLLTRQLLQKYFLPHFGNNLLDPLDDASIFPSLPGKMAITTDSFVIDPIFFPGGDIGKLAVCGTVNDLAVSGACPLYLTASFIIEEGFSLEDLKKVIISIAASCRDAGVKIITGDTKVVGRGQADKLFINTTGVGYIYPQANLGYHRLEPGDCIVVNGCLGNHGLAILLARQPLGLEGKVTSDCSALNKTIETLLKRFSGIKFMRDLTRGGLATNAAELAAASGMDIWLEEEYLPVDDDVKGITDLLGLDPLYLANEGKFLVVVSAKEAGELVKFLKEETGADKATIIGEVKSGNGNLYLKTSLGGTRKLGLLAGSPLPRIC